MVTMMSKTVSTCEFGLCWDAWCVMMSTNVFSVVLEPRMVWVSRRRRWV